MPVLSIEDMAVRIKDPDEKELSSSDSEDADAEEPQQLAPSKEDSKDPEFFDGSEEEIPFLKERRKLLESDSNRESGDEEEAEYDEGEEERDGRKSEGKG